MGFRLNRLLLKFATVFKATILQLWVTVDSLVRVVQCQAIGLLLQGPMRQKLLQALSSPVSGLLNREGRWSWPVSLLQALNQY